MCARQHRPSNRESFGIRYVTPGQRHAGQDGPMLAARHALYQRARERHPRRWSGPTRNWTPIPLVTLNPERDTLVQAATPRLRLSGSIGEPAFPSRPGNAQAIVRMQEMGLGREERTKGQSHPEPRAALRAWRMASTGPSPQ